MYRLSFITILLLVGYHLGWSQSPHGESFAMDCAKCHQPENWLFSMEKSVFNHDSTSFPLVGQHGGLECRSCHTLLEFKKVQNDCISCHTDIHQQTVGNDCARCHTPQSWIVENVTLLHEQVAFPLIGVHNNINCNACHQSETNVRFGPTGVECINCHRNDFTSTMKPDHVKNGFSTDCASCHSITGNEWNTDIVDHSFFPLVDGHQINDCAACHMSQDYSVISPNCISCHEIDFNNTVNPNHKISGFSVTCTECHTLSPDWKPVTFSEHDSRFFPIYSGKHRGVWNECSECHKNNSDFTSFTCVSCHTNPETDDVHISIAGYQYNDNACLGCHPTGDSDMAFDHNTTNFPLTGAHKAVDCISCHANGYAGTSTNCVDCHTLDYQQTVNPNHNNIGLSTDCASCHTTNPGWSPATFDIHNSIYPLNGAHSLIANDCISCHKGDYNNTPNSCFACHTSDYNGAENPNHITNQFSQDCASCHDENAWMPSTFNHDALYFPIYSGKHLGTWTECKDCHSTPGDFKQFTCTSCHINPETNDVHAGVSGYSYNDMACFACHPTGDADMSFNHNTTAFPLTGAHTTVDCISCHANGYAGTSTNCVDCHNTDFTQAINPNHKALNFSNNCVDCHTTVPGWSPALLSNHNDFYILNGAHAAIANNCVVCHNGDYNNTPNTCFACHNEDYNASTQPNHVELLFPQDCAQCHSESAWQPSTFNHDGLYFPIYSGKHQGTWNQCQECHATPGNWTEFSCIGCHQNPETNDQHNGVSGYSYFSSACLACHPTGDADMIFDHNTTMFPLTGAHTSVTCAECHTAGFAGTPTMCASCHTTDFQQAVNPSHTGLNLTTDCIICHTTSPGWSPAAFPNHNDFYVLNGAHAAIANNCSDCHNGNYTNTPNTCNGCHNPDYIATTNPNHITLQFPTDCASCHSEAAWSPSTFSHDNQYFPIYSGSHQGTWNECQDCHNNPADFSQFTCITCHQNPETNNEHIGISGYVYNSPACLACHPTGDAGVIFDHNTTGFPLTGGHITTDCISCHSNGFQGTSTICVDCHMTDFNQSTNPNHQTLGISTDCISCHSTAPGWSPAAFAVHDNYYVITGAHTAISNNCTECHNGDYNNTPNTCIGCHLTDFNGTTNPDHEVGMFPTDCTTCHSQDAWNPANFDHSIFWPLTGAHTSIANNCVVCHNGNYNNTSSDCVSCHQNDYNASLNPNHSTLSLSTDCITCHTTDPGWSPATFAIHDNFYVITGAHTAIANNCAVCHNGDYNNTPNTCYGCHGSDYTSTTNPNHAVNQFPTDCASCHNQNSWTPSSFNHNDFYPFTGGHVAIANDCVLCHQGNYSSTPNTCAGCHTPDYTNATNPNHASLGLSTDCASCHTTNPGWSPASFTIHDTYYVIAGAHLSASCADCHNGNYSSTPNTCYGCHQSDYNGTTNPNHASAQFPTDCTPCHTQNEWDPSTFDHDNMYFPIYSGKHRDEWNQCNECHTTTGNFTLFSCITCHEHNNQNQVNDDHDGVSGYSYNSNACYTCHPDGTK